MQYILAEALSSHCDNCPPCLSGAAAATPLPPRRPICHVAAAAPGSAPAQGLRDPWRERRDLLREEKGLAADFENSGRVLGFTGAEGGCVLGFLCLFFFFPSWLEEEEDGGGVIFVKCRS